MTTGISDLGYLELHPRLVKALDACKVALPLIEAEVEQRELSCNEAYIAPMRDLVKILREVNAEVGKP